MIFFNRLYQFLQCVRLKKTPPNAAYIWQSYGHTPSHRYWFFAEPVHFSLQRDTLSLSGLLSLSADESQALCGLLNAHFLADDLQFHTHEKRWFLSLAKNPHLKTTDPKTILNQDIKPYLAKATEPHNATFNWRAFENELQMLLFDCAVNQAREAQKLPTVSSFWCHGGGFLASENT